MALEDLLGPSYSMEAFRVAIRKLERHEVLALYKVSGLLMADHERPAHRRWVARKRAALEVLAYRRGWAGHRAPRASVEDAVQQASDLLRDLVPDPRTLPPSDRARIRRIHQLARELSPGGQNGPS